MNILESLRKIENKIYREQDKSIDLQGMFLKEDVDKEKLWEMINKNDIDGVIKLLESDDLGVADWEATDFGDDPVGEYPWSFITSKSVKDFDGFWTDYSLWMEWAEDEEGNLKPLDHFVFIFGDKSVYTPENSDWDWEADSAEEAQEWFDNYTGFEDVDLDESIDNKELKEEKRNGKFQIVYWLVYRGTHIYGPENSYDYNSNNESEYFWYNITNGYQTLAGAKSAARRLMMNPNFHDDIDINKYRVEFESDISFRVSYAECVSTITIKNPKEVKSNEGEEESFNNKELKEAKLGPYKYRYEIRYTAPNGKDYLEGASNDIDKAENVALSGCDHWYESPWESDEHKADVISSYRIIDSDSNSSVETDRLPLYKNKLLKMLTKSKLKEDANSFFEFRTKDLQSASKIASYIRNHFEVDPITDRDDSYEWYCIKAELTPDQKREARQFVKKFGGYILGENLKESKKGTVEQMWDGDTYSYHLYVDGKKVASFWEFDEVEDFAKNHNIVLEESLNKKNLKESMRGNDIELEMSSIKELIEWLETHPFDKVEDINIEVNNGRNSFSYYLYWSSPRVNVGSYPIVQIDRNDKTIFSKEGDELPTKESYKNFINETIDFLKNYTESFVENLKESVYTENGFKNRKEYLNSLADDFGVDVQTVYDLASVLGPDEDFDALVTELEDVAYSQDDDHDGDTEYAGKQFGLTSYYDDKLRGVEDYIELNWGDDPDLENWIWDKCSHGNYVVLRDWSNGEETKFRPVEEDDIDVKDLIVSKSGLFGTDGTVK